MLLYRHLRYQELRADGATYGAKHTRSPRYYIAGSMQHLMEEMFTSANRPFFQSSQIMLLDNVPAEKYLSFANGFFKSQKRSISKEVFSQLYHKVDGITWYIQSILNRAYQYAEASLTDDFFGQIVNELVCE